MKTNNLLLFITLLLFFTGCTKESLTENKNYSQVSITGNTTNGFSNNESRAGSIEQIPIEDSILFYSTGGVKANGDILHYENEQWIGLKDNKWYIDEGPANITAYYPVINDAEDLYYENGELKDFVFCKNTFNLGETINLTFNHLFAKFVINIDKRLNDTIKKVHINIPLKVSGINFLTGEYTTSENSGEPITLEKNESGKYEVFIPGKNGMSISFNIESNNITSKDVVIEEEEFKSGYEYVCNVSKKGIHTTEDFIAFTHLINGETEYEGKKLEDFYTTVNGRRVFNLCNDLSFTDEEALSIRRIGDKGKSFDDIFDGNNHTINNISINTSNTSSNIGLFDKISENGIVRNLTISNCKNLFKDKDNVALFAGINYGIVDNCHIINGIIPNSGITIRSAGFIAYNNGYIINCSVAGLQFDKTTGKHGIFTYSNDAYIMNCRIKNDLNKSSDGNSSSIIAIYNNGNIFNIFIENYQNGFYGICHTNENLGQYYNCILPKGYSNHYIGVDQSKDEYIKGKFFYSDTQEEYEEITNMMNLWIDDYAKEKYPQFTFRKWKTDATEKVVFE